MSEKDKKFLPTPIIYRRTTRFNNTGDRVMVLPSK